MSFSSGTRGFPHYANGNVSTERWQPRRDSTVHWGNGDMHQPGPRHGRQKSLGEAINTIRTRRGSVSANAHEIADALKAPVSPKLVVRARGHFFLNRRHIH